MRQSILPIKLNSFNVVENGTVTIDLPRQYDYKSLWINVDALVNVTTAFTAARAESPTQIIKRVDLIADGTLIVQSWTGQMGTFANFDRLASVPITSVSQIATAPSVGVGNGKAASFSMAVDFDCVRGIRPKDTSFRSYGKVQWQLRVTFGQCADLYTGAGVGTIASGTVTVSSVQTVEYQDKSGKTSNPPFLKRVNFQSYPIPSANTALEFRLNTGNLIKAVYLRASINGEPSDAVINNAILQAAQDVRFNMTRQQIVTRMLYESGPRLLPGYYALDFTCDGNSGQRLSNAWDVSGGVIEPKLILDTLGGAGYTLDVATVELQPIKYA